MSRIPLIAVSLAFGITTAVAQSTNPPAPMAAPAAAEAPVAGANSFTEAQARSRIEKEGYSAVTGLAKDSNGVWKGTATKGGKTAHVSVDFKGNVVAN